MIGPTRHLQNVNKSTLGGFTFKQKHFEPKHQQRDFKFKFEVPMFQINLPAYL